MNMSKEKACVKIDAGMLCVKLNEAKLCVDCDAVFSRRRSNDCPICGSTAVMPLGRCVAPLETVKTIQTARTDMEVRHGG